MLTVTVPDQSTADLFHNSTSQPPVPSPTEPRGFATKAEAAALALSSLAHAGTLQDIPLASLGANLVLSPFLYPTVLEANISISFLDASRKFTVAQNPRVDSRASALEAFAEAAAFELAVAVRALPELPDSIGVCYHHHPYISLHAFCLCLSRNRKFLPVVLFIFTTQCMPILFKERHECTWI